MWRSWQIKIWKKLDEGLENSHSLHPQKFQLRWASRGIWEIPRWLLSEMKGAFREGSGEAHQQACVQVSRGGHGPSVVGRVVSKEGGCTQDARTSQLLPGTSVCVCPQV